MDGRALGVVRNLFAHVDASLPRETATQSEHARRLFAALGREGGQVEAFGDVECMKTRTADLGTWSEDPWPGPTYGLDASSTRPIEYTNGLVLDTAHAKLGVAGGAGGDGSSSGAERADGGQANATGAGVTTGHTTASAPTDRAIEADGTVVTVAYFDDPESGFYSRSFTTDGGRVDGEVLAVPGSVGRTANVSRRVSTAAQRLAEGRHAAERVQAIDGVLFLDGSVYPLGVLYWLMLDAVGRSSLASAWKKPREIVGHYVDLVDTQYERGVPVIGVVKTSTTGQVLDALEAKIDAHELTDARGNRLAVPWRRDHGFVGEVLRDSSLDHLTYTSWFVQQGVTVDSRSFEPLSPVADRLTHGDPADYRRAFFYARLPKTGAVLRVETPLLLLEDERLGPAIRWKALSEIARRGDVPGAVARADRLARISPDNRERIRGLITAAERYHDYNRDGRWKHVEDPSEIDR
ncbi:hypothetical protein BRC90_04865 [Halobacteriales archaeon QS_4_69_34]|nr:MAG: hypothetical protein BRC90_04865 [Halobacteriales archaeon QS_4_69_34]